MNLTVRINGVEYKNCVAQGITFSEEFNETLDSCVCRITHVPRISNLEPYDDVYIYDTDNFDFDHDIQIMRDVNGGTFTNGVVRTEAEAGQYCNNPFYRHFLLDQFTETIIKLGSNREENICDYALELFSETKRLEKIQLPNLSITQPLNARKRKSVWEYLNIYLGLYSPKIKVVDDATAHTWKYAPKYSLDPSLEARFGDIYCPEFTLSNPTFRDILSQLMIVADCIPYVRDDVIFAMDISKRGDSFSISDEMAKGRINYITSSKSSDDYCDNVRRPYSQALAENGLCTYVEQLGFRNKDKALVSLEELSVETTHNIYKVNKMYMCYYRQVTVSKNGGDPTDAQIFIRQDITNLVKLNSEWALLSQDWKTLQTEPKTIQDLAKYKLATVHYTQGGNTIDGWGTTYSAIGSQSSWLQTFVLQNTYIQNIVVFLDTYYPFGTNGIEYYSDLFKTNPDDTIVIGLPYYGVTVRDAALDYLEFLYNPTVPGVSGSGNVGTIQRLKSITFEIEYSGFFNGALYHSRDNGRDRITANDNSSSSLALLEKDGLNQKEKLNRFANKTYQIQGKIFDIENNLLGLSQVTELTKEDDDIIIYKREYSIYDNDIAVNYLAIKNYVLRDYFISVYSKYRTYQLMSYGESVSRAEAKKQYFLLSSDLKYKDGDYIEDDEGGHLFFKNIQSLFSAFNPSSQDNKKANAGMVVNGHSVEITEGDFVTSLLFDISLQSPVGEDGDKPYVLGFFESVFANASPLDVRKRLVLANDGYCLDAHRYMFNDVVTHYYLTYGPYDHIITSGTIILEYDVTNDSFEWSSDILEHEGVLSLYKKVDTVAIPPSYNGPFIGQTSGGFYCLDCNIFTSGKMLCMNVAMRDNISGGVYIRRWSSDYKILLMNPTADENYTVGTEQGWYDIVDDDETGEIKDITWVIQKLEVSASANPTTDAFYAFAALPRNDSLLLVPDKYIYDEEEVYKDNKEILNKTYQLEPISIDKNIVTSEWLAKLSDISGAYKKRFTNVVERVVGQYSTFTTTNFYVQVSGLITSLNDTYKCIIEFSDTDILGQLTSAKTSVLFNINKTWSLYPTAVNVSLVYQGYSANYDNDIVTIYGGGTLQLGMQVIPIGNLEFTYDSGQNWWQTVLRQPTTALGSYTQRAEIEILAAVGVENEFAQNCFIVVDSPMDKTIIYEEPKKGDSDFEGKIVYSYEDENQDEHQLLVSDVFSVQPIVFGDTLNQKIVVDLSRLGTRTAPYSVQYWYFDDKNAYSYTEVEQGGYNIGNKYTYSPQNSAYHIVFGVNITQEDIDNHATQKEIYISSMTNRDTAVFSPDTGEIIGEINNCIVNGQYQDLGYTYSDIQ